MTKQPKDSAAVLKAGELLRDPEATVEELRSAQSGIRDEMQQRDGHTLPEASQALSMAERAEILAQREQAEAQGMVLSELFRRLGDAISRRVAADAIEGAEESRTALQKALEQAEQARSEYNAACRDALSMADAIAKGRQSAGRPGYHKVGATPEQIDALQDLAAHMMEGVALKRMRLNTQLGDPAQIRR